MKIFVWITLALFLGSCAIFEKGVIEPKVDETYDAAVSRWCMFPIDIHLRALQRNTITIRSLTDNCGDWRMIRDALRSSE